MFLLSVQEIDRVKRLHGITSVTGLAEKTGVSRKTWTKAITDREPSRVVLDALAALGANPARVLTTEYQDAA